MTPRRPTLPRTPSPLSLLAPALLLALSAPACSFSVSAHAGTKSNAPAGSGSNTGKQAPPPKTRGTPTSKPVGKSGASGTAGGSGGSGGSGSGDSGDDAAPADGPAPRAPTGGSNDGGDPPHRPPPRAGSQQHSVDPSTRIKDREKDPDPPAKGPSNVKAPG